MIRDQTRDLDRPLEIEFIIESGIIGGAETQLVSLCSRLQQFGHHPSVVFLQAVGPIVDELRDLRIPTSSVREIVGDPGHWTPPPTMSRARTAVSYLKFGRQTRATPDVEHAMLDGSIAASQLLRRRGSRRPVLVAGILGARKGRHGLFDIGGIVRSKLFSRSLHSADAVVCNAPHLATEIVTDFEVPRDRVHVISNGVEIPDWNANVLREPPRGVVVANFHPYKGYDDLLTALALLEAPPLMHLCGTGIVRDSTRDRANQLGLGDRIVFVDPPADVAAELRSAQFAVHPSRSEGLSNAIIEQMAAGLPVIACNVGGNSVLIDDGVSGVLVPAGDPVALSRAIGDMVADSAKREQMGAQSRARAEQYSWDNCANAHLDLYRGLVAERHQG